MGTQIRPELSSKNKHWIDRHRYYELKHFCFQYSIWKKAYAGLDGLSKRPDELAMHFKTTERGDPTARCAEAKAFFSDRMDMLERAAKAADPDLWTYILKAVTEGFTYDQLNARFDIPCSKDVYYDLYRKFFWLLNKERQ